MSKFKVGDRVKTKNSGNYPSVTAGDTGIVVTIHTANVVAVDLGHKVLNFYNGEIEHASSFTINAGDYIDSREFTREECERFCELAVECGFGRGEGAGYHEIFQNMGVGLRKESIYHCDGRNGLFDKLTTNITTQFREFLNKEKGMKEFTKDDLGQPEYDGCKVEAVDGEVYQLIDDGLSLLCLSTHCIRSLDDFLWERAKKVTDRDGTVLFEREPEKVKLELEVTPEQAEAIRKQLNQ